MRVRTLGVGGRARARSKDELMRDFRNLVSDGEALVRSTADLSGDALVEAREQFRGRLADAKARVGEASRIAVAKGRHAAEATDEYIHRNPWPVIGVAAGVGFVVGALLIRR